MPQPRPAPAIIPPAAPAIASKPPAGAVVAKAPAGAAAARPVVTVVPPQNVVVKPPTAAAPGTTQPKPAATEQAPATAKPTVVPKAAAALQLLLRRLRLKDRRLLRPLPVARRSDRSASHACEGSFAQSRLRLLQPLRAHQKSKAPEPAPAPPAPAPRRVVMPQTGPRPVYKAPPVAAASAPLRRLRKAEESSAANRSSTAGRPALRAISVPGQLPAASSGRSPTGQFPGGPRPSIRHAPALPVPADQALRAVAPALAHGPDLARHGPAVSREHAQEAALLPREKLRDRSAPRIIEVVAAASSIRRRRKAR